MVERTKGMDDADRKIKAAFADAIKRDGIDNTFRALGVSENIITTMKKTGKIIPVEELKNLNDDLSSTVRGGDTKTVVDRLNNRVDVNEKSENGWTHLHSAASNGELGFVRFLINNRADINATENVNGWTPLHGAVLNATKFSGLDGYPIYGIEIIKLLIENGADVNVKGKDGWTPFDFARLYKRDKYEHEGDYAERKKRLMEALNWSKTE